MEKVYPNAEIFGNRQPERAPEPPRKTPDDIRLTQVFCLLTIADLVYLQGELEEVKGRNQIMPGLNKGKSKMIKKPDLYKAKYFRSAHTSLNVTESDIAEGKQSQPVHSQTLKSKLTKAKHDQPATQGKLSQSQIFHSFILKKLTNL